jgi:hypothetical protein
VPTSTFAEQADAAAPSSVTVEASGVQGTATFGDYGQCGSGAGGGCFSGL